LKMMDNMQQRELMYKVLVVGDIGVGKTSIIRRYVNRSFSTQYKTTVGVDFHLKTIKKGDQTVRLQLWDIAGQERFGSMTRIYYKDAIGAFVVFDISRPSTLDTVRRWKQDLDQKVNIREGEESIPVILLANKIDMGNNNKSRDEMDQLTKELGFIAWFETSAKLDKNIDSSVDFLLEIIERKSPNNMKKENNNSILLEETQDKNNVNDSDCLCS